MHLHDIILGLMLDRILQAKALGPVYDKLSIYFSPWAYLMLNLKFHNIQPLGLITHLFQELQLFSLKTALGPAIYHISQQTALGPAIAHSFR